MSEKSTPEENEFLFDSWVSSTPTTFDEDELVIDSDAKKPKLDIFVEMRNADLKNLNFLNQQTKALADTFQPLVAMRWFSAIPDSNAGMRDYHLILTNEVMNKNFWVLSKFPDLQWKLMAACGTGKVHKHQWIPMSKRRTISKVHQFMLNWYPWANDDELNLLTNNMTKDDFENFVKSTGATDDELKDALTFFIKESGSKEKAKGKK